MIDAKERGGRSGRPPVVRGLWVGVAGAAAGASARTVRRTNAKPVDHNTGTSATADAGGRSRATEDVT